MADPGDYRKIPRKRSRVDPYEYVADSPPVKTLRAPEAISCPPDLVRLDSVASSDSINSVCDLPEVNPDNVADLLGMFDGPDAAADPEVDSVVKSLQEEIAVTSAADAGDPTAEIKSENELCYLLEASDDELGLPPRNSLPGSSSGGDVVVEEFGFDGDIRVNDLSELGICGGDSDDYGGAGDIVAWDGLFDQESDGSKLTWQPESVSAL
ncbi:PREDICTED: uncharacterized protein LOC104821884 [Tarenaya hassleriana]|uniref:uncharacterized protein LOC104821884 n=1 Tax=Tarenaya hassleriana TaxID=28532 RepID=UPI00053CA00F|nr:PREDICTED: uncharacterized protein LOC104821884 [Tarenaya hassleriana]